MITVFAFLGVVFLATVSASGGPTAWAETFEVTVKCDMTITQVRDLAERTIATHDLPRFWETHAIKDRGTVVRLGFLAGHLKYVQLAWAEHPTRMASFQRIDLCASSAPDAFTTRRVERR